MTQLKIHDIWGNKNFHFISFTSEIVNSYWKLITYSVVKESTIHGMSQLFVLVFQFITTLSMFSCFITRKGADYGEVTQTITIHINFTLFSKLYVIGWVIWNCMIQISNMYLMDVDSKTNVIDSQFCIDSKTFL